MQPPYRRPPPPPTHPGHSYTNGCSTTPPGTTGNGIAGSEYAQPPMETPNYHHPPPPSQITMPPLGAGQSNQPGSFTPAQGVPTTTPAYPMGHHPIPPPQPSKPIMNPPASAAYYPSHPPTAIPPQSSSAVPQERPSVVYPSGPQKSLPSNIPTTASAQQFMPQSSPSGELKMAAPMSMVPPSSLDYNLQHSSGAPSNPSMHKTVDQLTSQMQGLMAPTRPSIPPPTRPSIPPPIQQSIPPPIQQSIPHPSQQPIPTPQHPTSAIPMRAPIHNIPPGYAATPSYSHPASTPSDVVGIIGMPLPLETIHDTSLAPHSPIQPILDPAFMRVTLPKTPRSSVTLQKTKLPFGITVTPYPSALDGISGITDEARVPVIDGPIVRCRRCRTYLNPYVQMLEQGMKWKCNLCFLDNEFPSSFDYDPIAQKYVDRSNKAELTCPVYEFIAPMEYMVRPPQPPVYLFILDVSYAAIATGMVAAATRIIASCLDSIPAAHGRTRIGLMTVDSALHFYSIPSTRSSGNNTEGCRMMVVPDLEDPVLPCPDDLLISLMPEEEGGGGGGGKSIFERTLKTISMLFNSTQNANNALGPALSAAIKLVGPIGGKVIVFQASLPSLGEGKLTMRDDPKTYGTAKENTLIQPATAFYKTLATECQRLQICVDLFTFNPSDNGYLDLATIGCVAKYTGGSVQYYERWDAASVEMVETFASDLSALITREVGLEAVIRIRASQGLSLNNYHGSFFLRSADLLSLPNVNRSHSYSAQISIDENLPGQLACFQTAVLHTSCNGERRIRVINAAYPITDDPKEVFASADVGALGDLLLKMASEKVLQNRLEDARDALINKINDVLTAVKNLYQTGKNPQLLVPPSLRLLPLLMMAISKSPCLRTGITVRPDRRSYYLTLAKILCTTRSLALIYPYLFAVHLMGPECGLPRDGGDDPSNTNHSGEKIVLPPALHLSSESLERHGLYVLHTGVEMYLWVGSQVHPELCQLIFGQIFVTLTTGPYSLPRLDNPWNGRLINILEVFRKRYDRHPITFLIRDDADPAQRSLFLQYLVEDRGQDGQPSYVSHSAALRDKIYSV